MKAFRCKCCNRVMNVSWLEFDSNQYCNVCFDERARASRKSSKLKPNTFFFMGEEISLLDERKS